MFHVSLLSPVVPDPLDHGKAELTLAAAMEVEGVKTICGFPGETCGPTVLSGLAGLWL